jgi:hypothetical protein
MRPSNIKNMKATRQSIAFILFCIFTGVIFTISSCKKEDESKTAPAIPPKAGFVMNFSDFSTADDTLKSAFQTDTYSNWGYSYINVAVWNAILSVGLAVPVASFVEAFNHEAVYHPNENNWTWSYNFNVGLRTYEAVLTGALESDSSLWEMRITKSGEYSNFLWYHGKSANNQTGGYWILIESPESPNDLVRIDWNKYADDTADIKYTNIKPGAAENGGYIFYGTSMTNFDRFYTIYNKGLNNLTEIAWNSILKNGHVKDPHHFNTNSWHCWDDNLLDITCP